MKGEVPSILGYERPIAPHNLSSMCRSRTRMGHHLIPCGGHIGGDISHPPSTTIILESISAMQDERPVAYYSKKLNSAQMNYATIDKELLCVVATLREFRSMLFGADLHIHTDHKNILNSSERRLRWISYVDEYGPTLHYVEGPLNVIADTLSRLACNDINNDSSALVGKKAASVVSDSESTTEHSSLTDDREILECLLNLPCLHLKKKKSKRPKKRRKLEQDSHYIDHCYLNLPEDMIENNPLNMKNIKEKQDQDADLQQSATRHPESYSRKDINSIANVLCYTRPNDNLSIGKLLYLMN